MNNNEFLRQLNDRRFPNADEELKVILLEDLTEGFNNIRSRCDSDEEAREELLKSLGISK